mmetsp:Transcript_8641/g.13263  ORF Transcript_8641/g.13263 Transcript_8641/m.13263 type:complete len:235 (-) Transcript_8641:479-1183(-)
MAQRQNCDGIMGDILQNGNGNSNRVEQHLLKVRSSEMLFGMKHFESDIVRVEREESACVESCVDTGKRGVVYELLCTDTTIPGEPQWSVWRTAEEFADLDRSIRRTYPDLLKRTPFPSKSFPSMLMSLIGLGGLAGEDPDFTAKLKAYWRQGPMAKNELTDFANPQCSVLVKNFVQMDTNVEQFLDHAFAVEGELRYHEDDGYNMDSYLDDDTYEGYADAELVRKLSYDAPPFK